MNSFSEKDFSKLFNELKDAHKDINACFPGEPENRQPVHTVYGGAHLFKHSTTNKLGEIAQKSFATYAPNAQVINDIFKVNDETIAETVHQRVSKKLASEAVEDFRIDFEDGFGFRPDAEEDECAVNAAKEVVVGMNKKTLPPFIGIRIKTLSQECQARSLRTLDIFITTLVKESDGRIPENFVVTLPKIQHKDQISCLVKAFEMLEDKLSLKPATLKMEFMIETPQSIFSHKGRFAIPTWIHAAKGRVTAAHFGTYDYTASLQIVADQQRMDHEACTYARHAMKVSCANTGLFLSDGATNVMPIEKFKAPKDESEKQLNMESIHSAWRLSHSHIAQSLELGLYQGWDLHPAQIPVRYASIYSFFLKGLAAATERLSNFVDKAAKATLVGDVFDDAATGQGLLNYFLRAENCGAIGEEELLKTGLSLEELRLRSFKKIVDSRSNK